MNRRTLGKATLVCASFAAAAEVVGCFTPSESCEEIRTCHPFQADGAPWGDGARIDDDANDGRVPDAPDGRDAVADRSEVNADGGPDGGPPADSHVPGDTGGDGIGNDVWEAGVDADASDGPEDVRLDAAQEDSERPHQPCIRGQSPADTGCLVNDEAGVFVSPRGQDKDGAGGRNAPLRSIQTAIRRAQGKSVYVCAGDYIEAIALDAGMDGATVFGGFDCDSWRYAASNVPLMRPSSGIPLTIKGLTAGVDLRDLAFKAPPTTAKGETSIASLVVSSQGVQMTRVKLEATDAQEGADGVAGSNYTAMDPSDVRIAGHGATGATGGTAQTCANLCVTAPSVSSGGGRGGDGANGAPTQPAAGTAGGPPIRPSNPAEATGAGGVQAPLGPANGCIAGLPGSAAPAAAGGSGATTFGALTTSGWAPSDGKAGSTGGVGQGGGGGGGGISPSSGGGGGGGCGGCGGAGGPGGKAGGSSFALLSFQSNVTLDGCTLTAGRAGNGGKGADGQLGQAGGEKGGAAGSGCQGGSGGQGGQGGGGGGGAAGLSVAIGYVGSGPTRTGTMSLKVASDTASGGVPGASGSPAAGKGVDGRATEVLELGSDGG